MLRFKISQFDRDVRIGVDDNLPAPFPGMWPTRIAWKFVRLRDQKTFSYIGKPTCPAAYQFYVLSHNEVARESYFLEFDRKHRPIYRWGMFDRVWIHPSLYGVYHHWQGVPNQGEHFVLPLHRRRLGGLVVYSPYRALSRERKDAWLGYVLAVSAYKPTEIHV